MDVGCTNASTACFSTWVGVVVGLGLVVGLGPGVSVSVGVSYPNDGDFLDLPSNGRLIVRLEVVDRLVERPPGLVHVRHRGTAARSWP